MSAQPLPLEMKPLSEAERVVDTFVAPSKTFTDLPRKATWWLPFLLVTLFGVGTIAYTVQKIGTGEMAAGMLRHMPSLQARVDSATPDQAAQMRASMAERQKNNVFTIPVGLIVGGFAAAGLFMAVANFAFGGRASYGQLLAVFWYSQLPLLLFDLLVFLLIMANVGTENYNPMNPVGTNVGYFIQSGSPVFSALLNAMDLFSVWIIVLQIMGVSRVAKIKTDNAAAVVLLCWAVYIGVLKILPLAIFG